MLIPVSFPPFFTVTLIDPLHNLLRAKAIASKYRFQSNTSEIDAGMPTRTELKATTKQNCAFLDVHLSIFYDSYRRPDP